MKRTVVVNGEEFDVDVAGEEVVVDGTRHVVEVEPRAEGFDVRVDGEYFDVALDKRSFGVYDGTVDGTRAELLFAAQAKKRGGPGAGRAHRVEAPMPGSVLEVDVEAGQQVEVGTRLLTLEAMKMENEIVAEHGGVVHEVHVEAGEAVDGGDALIVVGPAEEE